MSAEHAWTICLTGWGFCLVGLLTRFFASHPLLMVRWLTGRALRRTPSAWDTPKWRQGMRGMSVLQLALGVALALLGGGCLVA